MDIITFHRVDLSVIPGEVVTVPSAASVITLVINPRTAVRGCNEWMTVATVSDGDLRESG